jgi:hypothetical protein
MKTKWNRINDQHSQWDMITKGIYISRNYLVERTDVGFTDTQCWSASYNGHEICFGDYPTIKQAQQVCNDHHIKFKQLIGSQMPTKWDVIDRSVSQWGLYSVRRNIDLWRSYHSHVEIGIGGCNDINLAKIYCEMHHIAVNAAQQVCEDHRTEFKHSSGSQMPKVKQNCERILELVWLYKGDNHTWTSGDYSIRTNQYCWQPLHNNTLLTDLNCTSLDHAKAICENHYLRSMING